MNRILPLLVLPLSGCWPFISGPWSDYDVPDETRIVGSFGYIQPLGDYFGDVEAFGTVSFGWLETPIIGQRALIVVEGCVASDPEDEGDGEELEFEDIDVEDVSIRNELGGSLDLEFDPNTNQFVAEVTGDDVVALSTWSLDPVSGDPGTFSVERFVEMPPRFEFGGVPLSGDEPEEIPAGDLTFTWTPEDGAQWVAARAQLDDADGVPLEVITCWVPADAGALTITEGLWDDMGDGGSVTITLATANETASKIDGVYGGNHMGALWMQIGLVTLE